MVYENVSLHDKNWFKTGGTARFFCEPTNSDEFAQALEFARRTNSDIFMLGQGANILISDQGFSGVVIRPLLKEIVVDRALETVCAGAGVEMPDLITTCLQNNLIGLEEFSGIPGTVGGSVYINIHYFQFLLSTFLLSARVIERSTGAVTHVDAEWFNFGYNTSKLQNKDYYLLDVLFKLRHVDDLQAAYAQGRSAEMIRHRLARYPYSRTCGSFFRNFYPEEIPFSINDKKITFVAYYLDKIGVKGVLRNGNAVVSHQHANMIVTLDGACTADVIALAQEMQRRVYENFGIIPQPECQLIGFEKNPLM